MRSHRGEIGQASSYILGVQQLTMSCAVLQWFWGFCENEAPRGQMELEWGGEGRVGVWDSASLFSRTVSVTGVWTTMAASNSVTHCIVMVLCVAGAQR